MGKVDTVLKVNASSLVEVTVAMVLLTLTIGMAFTILLNISRSGETSRGLKWCMLAEAHAAEAIQNQLYIDEEVKEGEVILVRQVWPHEENSSLLTIEILVKGEAGDTLARHRELVYVAEQKN